MPPEVQPPQPDGQSPVAPQGTAEPLIFEGFEGINTATTRPGVADNETAWLDNFMPLGPARNLRTMHDVGPLLFQVAGVNIAFFDFINIGAIPYCLIFMANGSIYAMNTNTLVFFKIAANGTIQNPSPTTVGVAAYGSTYALIVAQQTNGYFIWDGTNLFVPGSPFGGGSVPTGISGSAIEVYAGRIWIANNATITFSAPGSLILFSTGAGGGNFTSSDSFLRVQFTGLRQTNGFLYLIADSSVNYISGVQTSGSPPTTTFTNQNLDPEIGTPWPGSIDIFNRNIIFANAFGVHIAYGGAVSKVSEKLDGVYNTVVNFGSFTPSAAKAILFGKKIWLLLLPIIDPVSGQQVNKLFCWNSKLWWAAHQSINLSFIQHQEINSVLTAWGTDGNALYQLFQTPSNAIQKVAQSKLWDHPLGYEWYKFAARIWMVLQYYSNDTPAIVISIDNETNSFVTTAALNPLQLIWTNNTQNVINWTNNLLQPLIWNTSGSGFTVLPPTAIGQNGVLLGMTFETNSADVAIVSGKITTYPLAYRG